MTATPSRTLRLWLGGVLLLMAPVKDTRAEDHAQTWLTSTRYDDYGKQDRVPKPWTPVSAGDREVSVWGRRMRWKDSLLPASLTSVGTELLKAPMRLVVSVAGKEHAVPLDKFRVVDQQRHRVTLSAEGEVAGLWVTADMWVEYDGFLWVTLATEDSVARRKVDSLRVLVPLDAKQTTLYQTFSRPRTGWIGKEPIQLPWLAKPSETIVDFYHWFGDEDKGLGFPYTSLAHWAPESEQNFCTLSPGKDVTT